MKISDILAGYWLDKRLGFSEHTIAGYTVTFQRLIDYLNDKQFDQVTSTDIRRFLAHVADEYELSSKSLANVWIALSSLWTWAEKEVEATHIIRGKVKRPRYTTPVVETFTQDEVKALLKAAEYSKEWKTRTGKTARTKNNTAGRNKAIILVLLDTGIRAQELCDLTIADYDQRRGRLHIRHGKGDKQRYVVLGNRSQKAVWKYLTDRGKTKSSAPLFAADKVGEHIQRDNLRHMLVRVGNTASVNKVYPHKFRHTFAINFLRNGGNVLLLKELLGHESLEMVMHYTRIVDQDIEQAGSYSPADNWKV